MIHSCAEWAWLMPRRPPVWPMKRRVLVLRHRRFSYGACAAQGIALMGCSKVLIAYLLSRAIKVHPHMLRHAAGFVLANKGTDTRTLQAYLGHRSIQSTVRYTDLAPGRFKNLWR
jgi:site-specific recombinase XerD